MPYPSMMSAIMIRVLTVLSKVLDEVLLAAEPACKLVYSLEHFD